MIIPLFSGKGNSRAMYFLYMVGVPVLSSEVLRTVIFKAAPAMNHRGGFILT